MILRQLKKSKDMLEESKQYLAGGVASSLRLAMKPVPLFLERGQGSRVWDVDGNEYVDYILAYGPLILGHSHPELVHAISEQMTCGQTFGMQHRNEMELARRVVELVPGVEKVVFSGSGTDAVMLALRLSRAYTGRQKIVRFEGHYHGWSDSIFTSFPSPDMRQNSSNVGPGTAGQSAIALEDVIVIPWNDEAKLIDTLERYGDEIAAVITEPVMCNSGCLYPKQGYLETMRQATREKGIVLIFDEVITGFRVSPGGAQQRLGILPDLTTMGKAIAGGIALSAVGGRSDVMDLISNGVVSHLGTLNGNSIAMTAGLTTLQVLNKEKGTAYNSMEKITNHLVDGIKEVFQQRNISHLINQFGPVFHFMFTDETEASTFDQFNQRDSAKYAYFAQEMLMEGVLVRPNGLWYISAVHSEKEVVETLSAIKRVALKM
jgi:glutamate-1-semialdehyde 2,1-aminomutase